MPDDFHYMAKAIRQAELAAEQGEVPVGAIIVLADGQQFLAHNEPITLNDPSAHAEMRAIRAACAAVGNYRLAEATLYVTLEPCSMCAGAIVHARIGRVVYGTDDPKTGAVTSLYHMLADKRLNHQPTVTAGIMAEECSALLKTFFRHRRQSRKKYAE